MLFPELYDGSGPPKPENKGFDIHNLIGGFVNKMSEQHALVKQDMAKSNTQAPPMAPIPTPITSFMRKGFEKAESAMDLFPELMEKEIKPIHPRLAGVATAYSKAAKLALETGKEFLTAPSAMEAVGSMQHAAMPVVGKLRGLRVPITKIKTGEGFMATLWRNVSDPKMLYSEQAHTPMAGTVGMEQINIQFANPYKVKSAHTAEQAINIDKLREKGHDAIIFNDGKVMLIDEVADPSRRLNLAAQKRMMGKGELSTMKDVRSAALQSGKTGELYEARSHLEATKVAEIRKFGRPAKPEEQKFIGEFVHGGGFVTKGGTYLTREEVSKILNHPNIQSEDIFK